MILNLIMAERLQDIFKFGLNDNLSEFEYSKYNSMKLALGGEGLEPCEKLYHKYKHYQDYKSRALGEAIRMYIDSKSSNTLKIKKMQILKCNILQFSPPSVILGIYDIYYND